MLCATALSLGQVQNAYSDQNPQKKLIQEDEKAVKKAIAQVHKDIVKGDTARLAADQEALAQAQQKLEQDRGGVGSASS
jgi:hypothetical protein